MELIKYITLKGIFVFSQVTLGTCMIHSYVQEGDAVNLTCPMKIPMAKLIWRGPPNLKIYASGTTKVNIQNVRVIHVENTNKNILELFKFEVKNEGLYQCLSFSGGENTFNIELLRTPNVSIEEKCNTGDETISLSCMTSADVPENYTYQWEHKTNAGDHIRFLSSKPTIKIKKDPIQNNGVYNCRIFSSIRPPQIAEYNLSISAVPHFVYYNTKEHYIYLHQENELKVYYTANPNANFTILEDNKPVQALDKNTTYVSVKNATVVDYIYNKSVNVHGYEIDLRILIHNRLEFSNITVLLQNDIGSSNHTIQVKAAKKTVQKATLVGNTQFMAPLLTVSSIVLVAAVVGLKFVCSKYITNSCEDNNTVTPNGIILENDYDASAPQRQNEVQASFVNDIYSDVSQLEVTTQSGPLILPQRTVFQDHSCTTESVSRIKENKELHYIEVDFNQNSNQRRHRIHTDDRTPYADVDLTIKVDPLPDTESEGDEDSTS